MGFLLTKRQTPATIQLIISKIEPMPANGTNGLSVVSVSNSSNKRDLLSIVALSSWSSIIGETVKIRHIIEESCNCLYVRIFTGLATNVWSTKKPNTVVYKSLVSTSCCKKLVNVWKSVVKISRDQVFKWPKVSVIKIIWNLGWIVTNILVIFY